MVTLSVHSQDSVILEVKMIEQREKVCGEEGWGREFVSVDCLKVVEVEGIGDATASVVTFVVFLTLPTSLHL